MDEPERSFNLISLEKQIMYLLLHKKVLEVSEIIEIYQKRKKSNQVIRNSLYHLKKQGYIENAGHHYSLTPLGYHFINALQAKFERLKWPEWNGQWSFVCYGLPDNQRSQRMALRRDLIQLGYGQIYQNILVSAHNERELVLQIIEKHQAQEFVSLIQGRFIIGDMDAQRVQKIWELASIQARYLQFIGWVKQREALLHDGANLDPLHAFLNVLELGEFYGEMLLRDPFLPPHLLPPDWLGNLAFEMYTNYYTTLRAFLQRDTHLLDYLTHG